MTGLICVVVLRGVRWRSGKSFPFRGRVRFWNWLDRELAIELSFGGAGWFSGRGVGVLIAWS